MSFSWWHKAAITHDLSTPKSGGVGTVGPGTKLMVLRHLIFPSLALILYVGSFLTGYLVLCDGPWQHEVFIIAASATAGEKKSLPHWLIARVPQRALIGPARSSPHLQPQTEVEHLTWIPSCKGRSGASRQESWDAVIIRMQNGCSVIKNNCLLLCVSAYE